eukprot:RCo019589
MAGGKSSSEVGELCFWGAAGLWNFVISTFGWNTVTKGTDDNTNLPLRILVFFLGVAYALVGPYPEELRMVLPVGAAIKMAVVGKYYSQPKHRTAPRTLLSWVVLGDLAFAVVFLSKFFKARR